MKTGILEVLLVNAKGITHTNLVGTPSYYVVIQCGNQTQRSKITSGKHEKALWNEKFIFDFSPFDSKHSTHLNCRIMDTELFTNSGFVGEAKIYIGGIISEGTEQGYIEIKPAAYSVVLEDDTYRGELKIGIKFVANREEYLTGKGNQFITHEKKEPRNSVCGCFWRISWSQKLFFYHKRSSKDIQKMNSDYHFDA
ncbi:hypothetical protein VNO78_25257 [Psophocarpus tetragonolobus]|uniref:C2 domain-containing protein n=1 Tax=Psophocarpus tetragonolobus TaxID=3891 RepID=A0AAN9S722_PSOTE